MTGVVCQSTYDTTYHQPVYQDCLASDLSCGALFTTKASFLRMTNAERVAYTPWDGLTVYTYDTDRFWTYDAGVAAWVRLPLHTSAAGRTGGRWRRVANQSISNSSNTLVAWDTEDADSDGLLTPTADTFTVPAGLDGLWIVSATTDWAGSTTSSRTGIVWVRGGTTYQQFAEVGSTAEPTGNLQGTTQAMILEAGDTFAVEVRQSSGSSLNMTGRVDVWWNGI